MKIVKKFGILFGALLLAAGIGVCQADPATTTATTATTTTSAPLKIAVVNVQQVLQSSPRVAELSKKLEAQFKARQSKIADEQKALQDQLDKFKKESPTMTQKARDDMQKKIAADRADLVKKVVAYQQDLQKEQNKIMQGILTDLNGIVSSIAKSQSFQVVFDASAVIYANDRTDITKDVAKEFNSKS